MFQGKREITCYRCYHVPLLVRLGRVEPSFSLEARQNSAIRPLGRAVDIVLPRGYFDLPNRDNKSHCKFLHANDWVLIALDLFRNSKRKGPINLPAFGVQQLRSATFLRSTNPGDQKFQTKIQNLTFCTSSDIFSSTMLHDKEYIAMGPFEISTTSSQQDCSGQDIMVDDNNSVSTPPNEVGIWSEYSLSPISSKNWEEPTPSPRPVLQEPIKIASGILIVPGSEDSETSERFARTTVNLSLPGSNYIPNDLGLSQDLLEDSQILTIDNDLDSSVPEATQCPKVQDENQVFVGTVCRNAMSRNILSAISLLLVASTGYFFYELSVQKSSLILLYEHEIDQLKGQARQQKQMAHFDPGSEKFQVKDSSDQFITLFDSCWFNVKAKAELGQCSKEAKEAATKVFLWEGMKDFLHEETKSSNKKRSGTVNPTPHPPTKSIGETDESNSSKEMNDLVGINNFEDAAPIVLGLALALVSGLAFDFANQAASFLKDLTRETLNGASIANKIKMKRCKLMPWRSSCQ